MRAARFLLRHREQAFCKEDGERLGHESPAFTLKEYAHVIPGMQADAARAIAELVSGTSSG